MKGLLLLQLTVFLSLLSGCVCGYEDVNRHEVPTAEVPAKVLRAFHNAYPDVRVQRIVRIDFKRLKISYNFYFRKDDGAITTAGVTLDGHVTEYEQKSTPK
jgi:hypothetical protein